MSEATISRPNWKTEIRLATLAGPVTGKELPRVEGARAPGYCRIASADFCARPGRTLLASPGSTGLSVEMWCRYWYH